MNTKFKINNNTNKILVRGDRDNEFIRAFLNLPKELQIELKKVIDLTLFDGYPLIITEYKA